MMALPVPVVEPGGTSAAPLRIAVRSPLAEFKAVTLNGFPYRCDVGTDEDVFYDFDGREKGLHVSQDGRIGQREPDARKGRGYILARCSLEPEIRECRDTHWYANGRCKYGVHEFGMKLFFHESSLHDGKQGGVACQVE